MTEQYIHDKNTWMTGDSPVTLQPTGKYPVVANLQWNTLADLLEFVCDPESTAIKGMVVAVVNDEYYDNNGTYQIDEIGAEGKVSKLGEHIYHAANEEDEKYLGNGFEGVQSYWKTVEIGDIPSGLTKDDELIYDQPVHRIIDLLLYKTLQPEVTEPTTTLEYEGDLVVLEGTKLPAKEDLEFGFDRGLTTYPYNEEMVDADPDTFYYTGEATEEWIFTGPEGFIGPSDIDWFEIPMSDEGEYTITYRVTFAEGETLWDNKRHDAEVESYPGGVIEKTITINAIKPMYANSGDTIDTFEQSVADYVGGEEVSFDVDIVKETETQKFELRLPRGTELVSVFQYNTISDSYNIPIEMVDKDVIPQDYIMDTFGNYDAYVRTRVEKDIQGASSYRVTIKRQ